MKNIGDSETPLRLEMTDRFCSEHILVLKKGVSKSKPQTPPEINGNTSLLLMVITQT